MAVSKIPLKALFRCTGEVLGRCRLSMVEPAWEIFDPVPIGFQEKIKNWRTR